MTLFKKRFGGKKLTFSERLEKKRLTPEEAVLECGKTLFECSVYICCDVLDYYYKYGKDSMIMEPQLTKLRETCHIAVELLFGSGIFSAIDNIAVLNRKYCTTNPVDCVEKYIEMEFHTTNIDKAAQILLQKQWENNWMSHYYPAVEIFFLDMVGRAEAEYSKVAELYKKHEKDMNIPEVDMASVFENIKNEIFRDYKPENKCESACT